ncbi:MAG: gliding motility-associated C-terminal domain-containing protein, partial [Bacteroidota bacterium]
QNTSTSNGSGNLVYDWTIDNNSFSTQTNPCLDLPAAGIHQIRLTARNLTGCEASFEEEIEVLERPMSMIMADFVDDCAPMSIDLSIMPTAFTEANWYVNGSLQTQSGNWSLVFGQPNIENEVILALTNKGKCPSADTAYFEPVQRPIAGFRIINAGFREPELRLDNTSEGASSFIWDFGEDSSFQSTEFEPVYRYRQPGRYNVQLIAANSDFCQDTASREFVYATDCELFIPSAFTPNGDGVNDMYRVEIQRDSLISLDYDLDMQIFNRLGRVVYETKGSSSLMWDGIGPNGKLVQEGVYVVVLTARIRGRGVNWSCTESRTVTVFK